jgi:hypothetical protein
LFQLLIFVKMYLTSIDKANVNCIANKIMKNIENKILHTELYAIVRTSRLWTAQIQNHPINTKKVRIQHFQLLFVGIENEQK